MRVECELAVRLARDLPKTSAPYTQDDVCAAVGEVMPGFELIEGRISDRSAEVIGDDVECPSLSPDATRLAFKQRTANGLSAVTWQIAVMDLATTQMPPEVADHVAAVAVFGNPASMFADTLSPGPLPTIGALYTAKSIDMCTPNDPICTNGFDWGAHTAYAFNGMANQAATFAAQHL